MEAGCFANLFALLKKIFMPARKICVPNSLFIGKQLRGFDPTDANFDHHFHVSLQLIPSLRPLVQPTANCVSQSVPSIFSAFRPAEAPFFAFFQVEQ